VQQKQRRAVQWLSLTATPGDTHLSRKVATEILRGEFRSFRSKPTVQRLLLLIRSPGVWVWVLFACADTCTKPRSRRTERGRPTCRGRSASPSSSSCGFKGSQPTNQPTGEGRHAAHVQRGRDTRSAARARPGEPCSTPPDPVRRDVRRDGLTGDAGVFQLVSVHEGPRHEWACICLKGLRRSNLTGPEQ
jgi:hypothetical protein